MDERLADNLSFWDERVPAHVASEFYDVEGFLAGADPLRPFEIEEMGSVEGRSLVHLQCHFGLDTLSWARRGARVTGLDFSEPAVEAAREIAGRAGIEADFVVADVHDAVDALGGRSFDIVYTGLGALIWLPDISRWAEIVAELLAPGGFLYLSEFHPLGDVFADTELVAENSYFHDPGGKVWDEPGSYTDEQLATEHNVTREWTHPLSDVVSALIAAGLRLELLHEHEHTLFPRFPFLEKAEGGYFKMPADRPRIPLMYSLRAAKPA
ncbi:class I SAM-dependent methyltransferase [Thermoleophilia bacterium SCSIO 60948]|nr:class I SAM-dependent methyltransferase [Thermoleophilia bacterium SCSIO 60948]